MKNKSKSTKKMFSLGYIPLIAMLFFVLYSRGKIIHRNYLLRKGGIEADAHWLSSTSYGSKGDIKNYYYFNYQGLQYNGTFLGSGYKQGDIIKIVFLPKKPSCNAKKEDILVKF